MKSFFNRYWGEIVISLIFIGFITFLVCFITSVIESNKLGDEEKTYHGSVIDIGYDPPSSGYKSHQDAQY
jgi:hypothetical protein